MKQKRTEREEKSDKNIFQPKESKLIVKYCMIKSKKTVANGLLTP